MQRAQIAIMPTNNARDVSAAASSTTALTIGLSHLVEHKANTVPFLFSSQWERRRKGNFTKTHSGVVFRPLSPADARVSTPALTWK